MAAGGAVLHKGSQVSALCELSESLSISETPHLAKVVLCSLDGLNLEPVSSRQCAKSWGVGSSSASRCERLQHPHLLPESQWCVLGAD